MPSFFDLPAGAAGAHANIAGIDAMLVWTDATGYRDHLRLGQPAPAKPPFVTQTLAGPSSTINTGSIAPGELVNQLKSGQLVRAELQLPVVPQRARPLASRVVDAPSTALAVARASTKRAVSAGESLIGVIDSGCPFAHPLLRDAGGRGTRILHLWDQDEDQPAFADVGGRRRADPGYGCEISRAALNRLMASFAPARSPCQIDEEACYRAAGYHRVAGGFSHGAAVLGLLAGPVPLGQHAHAQDDGAPLGWKPEHADVPARSADIVFVQLPRDAVQDSSSASLARHVLAGIRYIVDCAGPATQRIVVNISDGTSRTGHDGQSLVEQGMADLVAADKRLRIVLPAGNSHDEERHAQLDVTASALATATLRVAPATESPSYVTVRVPADAHGVQVRLVPPGHSPGEQDWVAIGQARAWAQAGGASPVCGLIIPAPAAGLKLAAAIGLVVIAPTASDRADVPLAPMGDWRIEARSANAAAQVHCWVSRNQCNAGALPRAHQARFVDVDGGYDPKLYLRPARNDAQSTSSPIRRASTLNGLGTAHVPGIVLVGGALRREREPADYSASGPALAPSKRRGPDLAAVTEESRGLAGVRSMGNLGGQVQRVVGTSFAAPQVARQLVNGGDAAIKAIGRSPRRVRSTPTSEPDPRLRLGTGRVG